MGVRLFRYWIIQFAGSVFASAVLVGFFDETAGLGASYLDDPFSWKVGLGMEIVLTFMLVTIIQLTSMRAAIIGSQAGIAVGSTIALCTLFGT